MILLLKILICWLIADFITGLVHWFEDKFMDSSSLNFLDSIAEENGLHHRKPTAMLVSSGWVNMKSSAMAGWPLAAMCYWIGLPMLVWLSIFFATFGNLIHRWAHKPRKSLPRWIRGMQEFGLFLSHEQHDLHHRSMRRLIPKHEAGYKFCGMTDWLNWILDGIKFWHALEVLFRLAGMVTVKQKLGQ